MFNRSEGDWHLFRLNKAEKRQDNQPNEPKKNNKSSYKNLITNTKIQIIINDAKIRKLLEKGLLCLFQI